MDSEEENNNQIDAQYSDEDPDDQEKRQSVISHRASKILNRNSYQPTQKTKKQPEEQKQQEQQAQQGEQANDGQQQYGQDKGQEGEVPQNNNEQGDKSIQQGEQEVRQAGELREGGQDKFSGKSRSVEAQQNFEQEVVQQGQNNKQDDNGFIEAQNTEQVIPESQISQQRSQMLVHQRQAESQISQERTQELNFRSSSHKQNEQYSSYIQDQPIQSYISQTNQQNVQQNEQQVEDQQSQKFSNQATINDPQLEEQSKMLSLQNQQNPNNEKVQSVRERGQNDDFEGEETTEYERGQTGDYRKKDKMDEVYSQGDQPVGRNQFGKKGVGSNVDVKGSHSNETPNQLEQSDNQQNKETNIKRNSIRSDPGDEDVRVHQNAHENGNGSEKGSNEGQNHHLRVENKSSHSQEQRAQDITKSVSNRDVKGSHSNEGDQARVQEQYNFNQHHGQQQHHETRSEPGEELESQKQKQPRERSEDNQKIEHNHNSHNHRAHQEENQDALMTIETTDAFMSENIELDSLKMNPATSQKQAEQLMPNKGIDQQMDSQLLSEQQQKPLRVQQSIKRSFQQSLPQPTIKQHYVQKRINLVPAAHPIQQTLTAEQSIGVLPAHMISSSRTNEDKLFQESNYTDDFKPKLFEAQRVEEPSQGNFVQSGNLKQNQNAEHNSHYSQREIMSGDGAKNMGKKKEQKEGPQGQACNCEIM